MNMKKLLAMMLLLLITLIANAQDGIWWTGVNEPDELKGLLGGPYFRYDVEGVGTFILWDWEDWKFRIITDKGQFDTRYASNGNCYTMITMGLYTQEGKLTVKFEDAIELDNPSRNQATINKDWMYFPNDRKKIKKFIRAIKSGEGYVRIICKRKDMQDFDLKITKYDIADENSTVYKEFTQFISQSTSFFDEDEYDNPNKIVAASGNKSLTATKLKRGEHYKILSVERQTMFAKVQLPNGKTGWIYAPMITNRKELLKYLPFRDKFIPNIETKTVAPGMTREEVFIITGYYFVPGDKYYKSTGDYVWYNIKKENSLFSTDYLFFKNSLCLATYCNGAFYYECYPDYKLVNVTRNETVIDNNVSSDSPMSYKDELLSVLWKIDRNKINFIVKNNGSSSIKIPWDDMAFVGLKNDSHRIIHKGVKYNEKEKEQPPSIVARNTELNDIIIPVDNIYFKESWNKWSAHPFVDDFLFSPEDESTKHPNGKKIQVLLPVIINEKKYEYQFVFEINEMKFFLMNSDYRNGLVADEL